jgi:apolipoprotein N-acyltransferase
VNRTRDRAILIVVSVAIVALVNAAITALVPIPHSSSKYESTLYALQTNISMQMKYYQPPDETLAVVSRALREIPEGSVVILPEATFMSDIRRNSTGTQLQQIAQERNLKILIGFPTYNDHNYNQVRFVTAEGFSDKYYAKIQLTPFVESLPWPKVFGVFSFLKFLDYFDAGEEFTIFSVDEHRIGAQICFDSLYSNVARGLTLNGANVIVTATNDGWFDISTALNQHLSKSIARAIENRRYVIQVSNTGISAIIDPYGRIVKRLPTSKELNADYVIGEFQYLPTVKTTLYTRFGNWFFWFSLFLGIALIILGGVVL